jgi:hypothetical protein
MKYNIENISNYDFNSDKEENNLELKENSFINKSNLIKKEYEKINNIDKDNNIDFKYKGFTYLKSILNNTTYNDKNKKEISYIRYSPESIKIKLNPINNLPKEKRIKRENYYDYIKPIKKNNYFMKKEGYVNNTLIIEEYE